MERTMGEKLVLIDGHSILNRAFFGDPGSDEFGRTAHECSLWIFEYYVQDFRGGAAGLSDGCI